MQVKLTAGFVLKAEGPAAGKDRVIYWDNTRPGFGLMVTAKGKRSFVFQYRNAAGESRRATLSGTTKLPDAHKWADIIQGDLARGIDSVESKRVQRAESSKRGKFKTIAEEYVKREGSKIRSMDQRVAILNRLVYPQIGDKVAAKLKRSDIVSLLDRIEDKHGKGMADATLMVVRRVCNWHATRDDDFRSPVVRGMGRTAPEERARKRILSDDEIRTIWRTADQIQAPGSVFMFAKLLQFLLLTAVRRNEGARMIRTERNGKDWLIPAARMKGKREFLVPLSDAAISVLESLPVIGDASAGPVFTTDGKRPLAAFGQCKRAFDKRCSVKDWTIHDLRRTARSLMSRAGVQPDHAERAVAHHIGGIRGIYDRHEYYEEKKRAFEALAAQIERILNPPADNVVPLKAAIPA